MELVYLQIYLFGIYVSTLNYQRLQFPLRFN